MLIAQGGGDGKWGIHLGTVADGATQPVVRTAKGVFESVGGGIRLVAVLCVCENEREVGVLCYICATFCATTTTKAAPHTHTHENPNPLFPSSSIWMGLNSNSDPGLSLLKIQTSCARREHPMQISLPCLCRKILRPAAPLDVVGRGRLLIF